MVNTHGKVVLLSQGDYKLFTEVVRAWRNGDMKPRQYPEEPVLGSGGGARLYRFKLREDAAGGEAEEEYEADIYQPDLVLYKEVVTLVDRDGEMASMLLLKDDWGVCWRYKGKYYYLTSGCGSGAGCSAGPFVPKQVPPTANLSDPYTWTPAHTGTAPTTWAATGLPPGLSIDSGTGEISGTPLGPVGTSTATVTATAGPCTATRNLTFTVDPAII